MRAILVNVATGGYVANQAKLLASLRLNDPSAQLNSLTWADAIPTGSVPHDEIPYAFKWHALQEVKGRGIRVAIWADSGVRLVRDPRPFIDAVIEEGHLFWNGGMTGARLGNRSNDHCLKTLGMTRDEAMELPLLCGTLYAFDLENPRTIGFLTLWGEALKRGCWTGFTNNEMYRGKPGGLSDRPVGWGSDDPRCEGHSHDEACATIIAHNLGMKSYEINERYFARHGEDAKDVYFTTGGP